MQAIGIYQTDEEWVVKVVGASQSGYPFEIIDSYLKKLKTD